MFVEGSAENQNVVEVRHTNIVAQLRQARVEEALESSRTVFETKWHSNPFR